MLIKDSEKNYSEGITIIHDCLIIGGVKIGKLLDLKYDDHVLCSFTRTYCDAYGV